MRKTLQQHDLRIVAILVFLAILLGLFIPRMADTESTQVRTGDVGFSLKTRQGEMWTYGDSWINGRFIRNAITLNGEYRGTLRAPGLEGWIWPGAPLELDDGRIVMYASQHRQAAPGMWGTQRIQTVRIFFRPAHPERAQIQPLGSAAPWSADSLVYGGQKLFYGVNREHRARVGYVNNRGEITQTAELGPLVSGRYTVLQDGQQRWWLVGFLPWLSRRVVAYPMYNPTKLKSHRFRLLQTLPQPADGWFVYDGLVHPEKDGLFTWAENGKGPGGRYGLKRKTGFWPGILQGDPASKITANP